MRVAVVGAGRWGRLHAAKLAATPGVRLVAIVDRVIGRAREAAAQHPGVVAFDRLDALPKGLDAATVAVNLAELEGVTAALLRRGVHVLAEKPLAMDAEAARRLMRLATEMRRVLAVGFLERFNPALDQLESTPARLVLRRVGPMARCRGPLHLDWLVHDVDLARFICGPELRVVAAVARPGRMSLDLAAPGRIVRATAALGAPHPRRGLWADGRRVRLDGPGDPLGAQLGAFIAHAAGGPPGRLALGHDAVAALELLSALNVGRIAA